MDRQSYKITANNLLLHVESFGDSHQPAIILVSGAMATGRFWSASFCCYLAKQGYFVIRYDHRDIGESGSAGPFDSAPYTIKNLAADLHEIVQYFSMKKPILVGHSMGGYIVQQYCDSYPGEIRRGVIISSGPLFALSEKIMALTEAENTLLNQTWQIMLARKDAPSIEGTILSFMPTWKYLNADIPLDESLAYDYTTDLLIRGSHPIKAGNHHEQVMREHSIHLEENVDFYKNLNVPVRVIHGEKDPLCMVRIAKEMAKQFPKAEFISIEGMGHMFFDIGLEQKIADFIIKQDL